MKKLFAILAATVLVFAFAACKKDNANTTPDNPPADDMSAPADNPSGDAPADNPSGGDAPATTDAPASADDMPAGE